MLTGVGYVGLRYIDLSFREIMVACGFVPVSRSRREDSCEQTGFPQDGVRIRCFPN